MTALLIVLVVAQIGGFACLLRRLHALPSATRRLDQRELRREACIAEDRLKEAVAIKAGACLVALTAHEQQLRASLAAQVAQAEAQARAKETQAGNSTAALQTACDLVRQLRAVLDEIAPRRVGPTAPPPPSAQRVILDDGGERATRRTGLLLSPAARQRLGSDEHTCVVGPGQEAALAAVGADRQRGAGAPWLPANFGPGGRP